MKQPPQFPDLLVTITHKDPIRHGSQLIWLSLIWKDETELKHGEFQELDHNLK